MKQSIQNTTSDKSPKPKLWQRLLSDEITVEFKSCLFFFCILFFYCTFRLIQNNTQADILHMFEMIILSYVMCYFQLYVLDAFDEGVVINFVSFVKIIFCSGIYVVASYFGKWFEGNLIATISFFAYLLLAYICFLFVNRFKRHYDEKILNEELQVFQNRGSHEDAS